MPKKQTDSCDFKSEVNRLKSSAPGRLYFLYGPEDYLSMNYLDTLRSICLPDGDDGFSLKRFEGPGLDPSGLRSALDVMPFLSERTFIELHNVDVNKLSAPDDYIKLLKDIPEYCTAAFIQDSNFEPDGRLKLIKFLKSEGVSLCFDRQDTASLVNWIKRRFSARGKKIDDQTCERLMFVSGTLMNRLIPEIEKIAGVTSGDTVTTEIVNTVANRIPEADVFEMINYLSVRDISHAAGILTDLLYDRKTEPIAVLSLIGSQVRRLYGVKLALESGLGYRGASEVMSNSWESLINKTISSAKGFTLDQLAEAVRKCTDADYLMKSSSSDDVGILKELIFRLV
ncbi:MAG: DNA polymerase III subunit delta [Eubacteriales bacterium]|nr:DNA polymerase III subunit delta [Eubacteriales bacterium]